MQSAVLSHQRLATDDLSVRPQVYPRLRISVLTVLALFVAYSLFRISVEPAVNAVWAIVIAATALAPAYLWATGKVGGLPILPAHAA